jgi:hypothetical protein
VLLDTGLTVNGSRRDADGRLYVPASDGVKLCQDPFATAAGVLWRIVPADQAPAEAQLAPLDADDVVAGTPPSGMLSTPTAPADDAVGRADDLLSSPS